MIERALHMEGVSAALLRAFRSTHWGAPRVHTDWDVYITGGMGHHMRWVADLVSPGISINGQALGEHRKDICLCASSLLFYTPLLNDGPHARSVIRGCWLLLREYFEETANSYTMPLFPGDLFQMLN